MIELEGRNDLLKIMVDKKSAQVDRLTAELQDSKKQVTVTLDSKEIESKLKDATSLIGLMDAKVERLKKLAVALGGDTELVDFYTAGSVDDGGSLEESLVEIVEKASKNTAPADTSNDADLAKPKTDLPPLSELTKPEADSTNPKKPKLFGAGPGAKKPKDKK